MNSFLTPAMLPLIAGGLGLIVIVIGVVVFMMRRSRGDEMGQRLNEFAGRARRNSRRPIRARRLSALTRWSRRVSRVAVSPVIWRGLT